MLSQGLDAFWCKGKRWKTGQVCSLLKSIAQSGSIAVSASPGFWCGEKGLLQCTSPQSYLQQNFLLVKTVKTQ